jgi:hypothetical protein
MLNALTNSSFLSMLEVLTIFAMRETTRPRSRRRPKPTADVLTSLSAINTSNHSCSDPGQRGAVALTDHELTEFA